MLWNRIKSFYPRQCRPASLFKFRSQGGFPTVPLFVPVGALGPPSSASPAATLTPARPTGPSRVCRDRSRISRSAGWRGFPRPRRPALGQHPLRGGVSAVISRPGMRDANWMYQQRSASPADWPTHAEYAVGRSQVSPASGGTGAHASILVTKYTRLQTVWSLPGPSRQANKGHSPRCHRRPNGPGRLADKVVQPTTQSAEGCT